MISVKRSPFDSFAGTTSGSGLLASRLALLERCNSNAFRNSGAVSRSGSIHCCEPFPSLLFPSLPLLPLLSSTPPTLQFSFWSVIPLYVERASVVRGDLLWELWGARALAVPRGTQGSARGGASKRRYCLVNLRFTSGWPPSKHHAPLRRSFFVFREVGAEILIAILPWREPIAFCLSFLRRKRNTWASSLPPPLIPVLTFHLKPSLSENLKKIKTSYVNFSEN